MIVPGVEMGEGERERKENPTPAVRINIASVCGAMLPLLLRTRESNSAMLAEDDDDKSCVSPPRTPTATMENSG